MKLYNELNPAPNPRRVRIFLAEKAISIPFVHVPLRQGAHKEPDFLAKNSLGQVPVLELDDGSTLSESIAICRYLEELHPQPEMFGATPWQRAQVEMWMRRLKFGLTSRIGAVWVHTHKFTAHLGTQYKDFGEASRARAVKTLHWLNDELAGARVPCDRSILEGRYRRADHRGLRRLRSASKRRRNLPQSACLACARFGAAERRRVKTAAEKKRQGIDPCRLILSIRVGICVYGLLGVLGRHPAACGSCSCRKFLTSRVLLPSTSL